jgi:gliding motility-associated-like protein
MIFKRYLLIALSGWICIPVFAQLPEQDCIDAIPVCQDTYEQLISYDDEGVVQELDYPANTSCLLGGEENSVWYIFTVTGAGDLEFQITPNALGDDYDWSIFDLTNSDCQGIIDGTAPEVRCNYSAIPGATGMSFPYTLTSVPANGPNQCAPLPVLVGETYVLLINNHANTLLGYTLQFGGSAVIYDTLPPAPVALDPFTCDPPASLHLTLSEPIKCNSIAANGSDFYILGPSAVNVIGASSPNCALGNFTTEIDIQLSAPITVNGDYVLRFKIDDTFGNILLDNCNNELSFLDSVPFRVALAKAEFLFEKIRTCDGDSLVFTDISGGDTVSTWSWDFGNGNTSTIPHPTTFYPLTGSYDIVLSITDTLGCTDDTSITINTYTEAPVSAFSVSAGPYCAGIPIFFTSSATGQSVVYQWLFGGAGSSNLPNPEFTFQSGGLFTVELIVTDTIGCSDTASILLDVSPELVADFSISPAALCAGDTLTLKDASLGVPTSYLWFGTGITGDTTTTVQVVYSAGTYQFTLIIDNPFCNADTATKFFEVSEYPVVYLGLDTDICIDETILLDAQNPGLYHLWSTGEETQMITVEIVPQEVWVLVDNNGCLRYDTVFIGSACPWFIPNAFTPNGDGLNDVFQPITDGNQEFSFSIFNRWGQLLFETSDPDEGWDGSFNGKESEMGTYVYLLKTVFSNGTARVAQGNVTLIR